MYIRIMVQHYSLCLKWGWHIVNIYICVREPNTNTYITYRRRKQHSKLDDIRVIYCHYVSSFYVSYANIEIRRRISSYTWNICRNYQTLMMMLAGAHFFHSSLSMYMHAAHRRGYCVSQHLKYFLLFKGLLADVLGICLNHTTHILTSANSNPYTREKCVMHS